MYNETFDTDVLANTAPAPSEIRDFTWYLDKWNICYQVNAHYIHSGEVNAVQGWLLHISVIQNQIDHLFNTLLPILSASGAPFKIPTDLDAAVYLNDGRFGNHLLGKIITIYPETPQQALHLAQTLIPLTKPFDGPEILTDAHLGGTVYTRYGAFKPMVKLSSEGKEVNYIYDKDNREVPDQYQIPFRLPAEIAWPFDAIRAFENSAKPKVIHHAYRPVSTLKKDVKGNVYKALYARHIIIVRTCVLKEAKKNFWSDAYGRDMSVRLQWQKELYDQLSPHLALPKIFDLFTEGGNTYLAMQYVKGPSLFHRVMHLNKNAIRWSDLKITKRIQIVDYARQLAAILEVFHHHQYVHRDVTPANFLVGKRDQLFPIDLELTYSVSDRKPYPPFQTGTRGFMSPQQDNYETPALEDDIYAFGATLLLLFTGLYPLSLDQNQDDRLGQRLSFFIGDEEIEHLIYRSLDGDPSLRPTLTEIQQALSKYTLRIRNNNIARPRNATENLTDFIECGLRGICGDPTIIHEGIWYSACRSDKDNPQVYTFEKSIGLAEGITGVLYVLSKTLHSPLDTNTCRSIYTSAWTYLFSRQEEAKHPFPPGLYGGSAGLALTLSTALRFGALEDSHYYRTCLIRWLAPSPKTPSLAYGAAGQGLALLQCREYLPADIFSEKINAVKHYLLEPRSTGSSSQHFETGQMGVLWFLLEYASQCSDRPVQDVALQSLHELYPKINRIRKTVNGLGARSLFVNNGQIGETYQGIVLVLLKAYASTADPCYLKRAEMLLDVYPDHPIHDNYTQNAGMAALGELYLEAHRLTKNEQWLDRAAWIVSVLMQTAKWGIKEQCYWLNNNQLCPTGDFMVGSGGILHFLIRFAYPEKYGYRILKK